ncbi:hypothetical protein NHX12_009327, partial [Muraenolepis orangiensis]
ASLHLRNEQKRRLHIRTSCQDLCDLLPFVGGPLDTATTLELTVRYIGYLKTTLPPALLATTSSLLYAVCLSVTTLPPEPLATVRCLSVTTLSHRPPRYCQYNGRAEHEELLDKDQEATKEKEDDPSEEEPDSEFQTVGPEDL